MSARKIGMLLLLLAAGAAIEAAWFVRSDVRIGPEGCRVIRGRFYGPSYTFEQTLEQPLTGENPSVVVRNAFGLAQVRAGAPGLIKARLRKVVYLPTEQKAKEFAERIELSLSSDGGSARVGTNRDLLARDDEVGFETHLEVEVPPAARVEVRSDHGPVEVLGVAAADVESSFDRVKLERIGGDVRLESRNGDVEIREVAGALELTSRHGEVSVREVKGHARLDVQHGSTTLQDCAGVEITQQHGSVAAHGIAGELDVHAGHAEVEASDVIGGAAVETSYAAVKLVRVGGDASAKADHGEVKAQDVSGSLRVDSSYGGVRLERIGGAVDVAVHHGGVDAKGLARGGRFKASGADAEISGFEGPLDLELERGDARVAPRAAIGSPVTLVVAQGQAQLELPQGSGVDLDVESSKGEITSDVPGVGVEHDRRTLSAKLGRGGAPVRIRARGDVRLTSRPAVPALDHALVAPAAGANGTTGAPAEAAPAPAEQPQTPPRPEK